MGFLERAIRKGIGDAIGLSIALDIREPYGGFDYVKPVPKKPGNIFDLFK